MKEQDLDTLLFNILRNTANEEEIKFFSNWVNDKNNSAYFEKLKYAWNLFELKSSEIPVSESGRTQYIKFIKNKQAKLRRIVLTSASIAAAIITVSFLIFENKKESVLPTINKIFTESKPINQNVDLDSNAVSIVSTSSQGKVLKVTKLSGAIFEEVTEDTETDVLLNTLIVPKGKRILMLLSDGTKMWVNSDSKVTYPAIFPNDKRVLGVVGNVFFDVAKDKSRPFEVTINGIKTTALGTQFEVNDYNGECTISLLEGRISVENDNHHLVVEPNEQVITTMSSDTLTKQKFNSKRYGLWRNNILVIENEPISSIITKLNRWHNVEIVNKTKGVENLFFTGKLDNGTLEEHLTIIADNIKLKFAKEGDKMIIWNE